MINANAEHERFRRFVEHHPLTTRTINGVSWEYSICGQGEPLLLLPGALATADTSFQYILAFERQYRVIAPTYPSAITLVAPLVDGLAALLRDEGCAPAHILGGSYSGLVTHYLATRHPDVIASLMLTNTGVPRPERARVTTLVTAVLGLVPETFLRWLFKGLIRFFLHESTPSQEFWRNYFLTLINKLSRDDYLSRLKVAIDFDRNDPWGMEGPPVWHKPVLLIEAADDRIFSPDERAALRQHYPHGTVHIQPASNHTASLDQAEATIALIKAFLNKNSQTPDLRSISASPTARRIVLVALGSRGDVQPFIALGVRLRERGYLVRVLAITDYADLITSYGLDYGPLVGSAAELMDRQLVYSFLDGSGNPLVAGYRFLQNVGPLLRTLLDDCWQGCQDADGLVVSTLGQYIAESIVERLTIPMVVAHFHPNSPTRFWPDMRFPSLPGNVLGREWYNRTTYPLAAHGLWQVIGFGLNDARRTVLDLPPLRPLALWRRVRALQRPIVYAYSALVAPPPPDWNERAQLTGYWCIDQPPGWQPPAELVAFLRDGTPPVYVGFGSTLLGRDHEHMTAQIVEALHRAGQRGILFRGWGDMGTIPLPPDVLLIDAVPHDWLFRYVAAVVHHGGAGTTAAAIRAGVPSIVVPVFGDMNYWGERVRALGIGPSPIPRAELSVDALTEAIVRATSERAIGERAAALGQRLVAEDGAGRAATVVEDLLFQ